jgi:hypothetical protein
MPLIGMTFIFSHPYSPTANMARKKSDRKKIWITEKES